MKKRRSWLVALSLMFSFCTYFCFAACNSEAAVPMLPTPTVTVDDGGKATWNEVEGASGYAFKINDGAEQVTETREIRLENGDSVAVKAKGDGVSYADSDWSKAETYTTPQDDPVKIGTPVVTIYEDGLATWDEVANASKYVVKIDGKEAETFGSSVQLKNGEAISVQAVGNGISYLTGDFSISKTYKAPANRFAAPENLTIEIQGVNAGKVVLNWNAVDGASGYRYIINGAEQNAVTVEENFATVDLGEIDATKLDSTWIFQVKALGDEAEEIANDGDYSDLRGSSDYCKEVEFAIADDEIYTVAEILKIMNYYGDRLPTAREFMVTGTIAANADGNAVLESGFTLFGKYVPELYLAIDERLIGLDVTAIGTLAADGEVRGLSSYRSVDFDHIAENDRYALVAETLYAWDKLQETSKIMGDFYLPVKLYGVNILWAVDDNDTDAFVLDNYGNVTVTCPAEGAGEIPVMLTAMLYVDDRIYEDELVFMFSIVPDTRTQLAAPKININPKTGVATWNEIPNATGYRVSYYGFSVPGDYYSEYVSEEITIPADGNRSVQLKDTWWISVQAIGDGITYKDSEVDPKQYNYYPETVEPDGTPLEFDFTKLTQTGELANANYIFGLACGNASVFESASATHVVLGNNDANGAVQGTGFIKVGSSNNKGKITLSFHKKINGVVITARQWNNDQKDKISVNGSEEQTASKNDWGVMYFNFTASKAKTTVEIDTDNRVFIKSIVVYVSE